MRWSRRSGRRCRVTAQHSPPHSWQQLLLRPSLQPPLCGLLCRLRCSCFLERFFAVTLSAACAAASSCAAFATTVACSAAVATTAASSRLFLTSSFFSHCRCHSCCLRVSSRQQPLPRLLLPQLRLSQFPWPRGAGKTTAEKTEHETHGQSMFTHTCLGRAIQLWTQPQCALDGCCIAVSLSSLASIPSSSSAASAVVRLCHGFRCCHYLAHTPNHQDHVQKALNVMFA